jgi:hypothetical protein
MLSLGNRVMKKTDNFFVISNFNYDTRHLLTYCKNYVIYDQSNKKEYKDMLGGLNVIFSKHSGHNISDYFTFFIENYDSLPEIICLIKGNIYPRHLSKEFFDKVYDNQFYTFLFQNSAYIGSNKRSHFLCLENQYLEFNNSWFIKEHPHWYFQSYNELLEFIYDDVVLPRYNLYSPGACYILNREQVLKTPKEVFQNLIKVITYTKPVNPFPSEAHQVEWLCHILYSSNYTFKPYMLDGKAFDKALIDLTLSKKITKCLDKSYKSRLWRDRVNKVVRILNNYSNKNGLSVTLIGQHSIEEVFTLQRMLAPDKVIANGILDIQFSDDELPSDFDYYCEPLESFIDSVDGVGSDLIIYEGYHLKSDIKKLPYLIDSHLNSDGSVLIGDVLNLPYMYSSVLRKELSKLGANYLVTTVVNSGCTSASDYLIIVEKKKMFIPKFLSLPASLLRTCYSNLHWLARNGKEHLKRKLPV